MEKENIQLREVADQISVLRCLQLSAAVKCSVEI